MDSWYANYAISIGPKPLLLILVKITFVLTEILMLKYFWHSNITDIAHTL